MDHGVFCSITNPNSFDEVKEILDNTIKNSDYTFSNKKIELIYIIIQ